MTKLEKYSHYAEIIGAIAVVISLIFVGVQVNRNTEYVKASTYQSMINLSHDRMKLLSEPDVIKLIYLDSRDPKQLDPINQIRLAVLLQDQLRIFENAFVQHKRGVVGEDEWAGYQSMMCGYTSDMFFTSWDLHKSTLSQDFVKFIDDCRSIKQK